MERTITGAAVKRAQINIKNKIYDVALATGRLSIRFGAAGYYVMEAHEMSLTRFAGETYYDLGHMLLGPITDDTARIMAELLKPDVTH